MKQKTLSLRHISQAWNAQSIVAQDTSSRTTWELFAQRVDALTPLLKRKSEQRWMLYAADATHFAVGFVSLLYANKTIILPPNMQPGTLQSLASHAEGALTDIQDSAAMWTVLPLSDSSITRSIQHKQSRIVDSPLPRLSSQYTIELFTSGSTGKAKCIPKTLSQLEEEVIALESMWGQHIDTACVFSTVSHQHIYGLLFRVLWPLAAGRSFWNINFFNPSALLTTIRESTARSALLVSTPTHLKRMLEWVSATEWEATYKQIQCIFSSGGPLAARTAHQLEEAIHQAPIEILGSSETGGVAWRQQKRSTPFAHWYPLQGVSVRAEKPESTLQVRSPYTPVGPQTWFTMSDRIQLHTDGSFTLEGRVDRIVKVAEKRVSLPALERCLNTSKWVDESKIVVLPERRPTLGAVIALTEQGIRQLRLHGKRSLNQELRLILLQHFESVTLPRRWRYVENLPYDAQGKSPVHLLHALFQKDTP